MRVLRTSLAMAAVLGFAPVLAVAQTQVTPEYLLTRYQPVFRGVDCDLTAAQVKGADPAIKAAVELCKVEGKKDGFTVRDGQGRLLRRFLDTDGKKTVRPPDKELSTHLDQWSYYQDGFEVYRESDLDEDGLLDEVRWMNSGGTRIAQVKPLEGGRGVRVMAWKRLSAEEASKVLVQAIVFGDKPLLESVMATPEELQTIGAPKVTLDRVADGQAKRAKSLSDLLAMLKETGWSGQTTWSRFDGAMPHVFPSDATLGLKNEILLYENVVIFADAGNAANAAKMGYLSTSEVVKIGDTWKFLDLPSGVDPVKPTPGSTVSLRGDLMSNGPLVTPGRSPALDEALKKLAKHDSVPVPDDDKMKAAQWHVDRLKILAEVIAADPDPAGKLNHQKQAVNDLCEAIRTEHYPEGLKILDKYMAAEGKIATYAQYRKILVVLDVAAEQPGANLLELQKDLLAKLEEFLGQNVKSDEEPDVLWQLGTICEFNGNEKDAKKWLTRLAKDFAEDPSGKKAAGVMLRMDIDGKPLKLAGTGLNGKAVSVEAFRGKPVVVVYWTSKDAADLRELATLKEKLGAKGFEVLGVSLDPDKATAETVVKDLPSSWATIYEAGGPESRLATEMGITATPTILLLDAKGQVVNRKIRKASEVEKALDKSLAGRGVGLNAGAIK